MENAEDEFDTFVRARTHALLRSAYLLTGDQQLSEDLVQSALSRTHQAWQRLADSGNAEAYARRTMYHLQVSWWRRRRVTEVLPERLPDRAGGDDHAGAVSLRLSLRAALLQLTVKQRAVLVLRFYEDCTETEAADLLGVSVGTVKSQSAKALARLRAIAPELADVDSRNGALS